MPFAHPFKPDALPDFSPKLLTQLEDGYSDEASRLCEEFIAAGRGLERPSQTALLTDPLALLYRENARLLSLIRSEIDRRKTWHGSLRRIRVA